MANKKPHIALLIMMKDEEKRLGVSLESVKGYVDSIVAYDTGSTDNTVKILKDFCETNKITLRLKEGEFTNFASSRNVSLDFADTFLDIDFCLLLDVNDELKGGEQLRKFAKQELKTDNNAYLICQHWWSGQYDKYFNCRFIKTRKGWRYKGSVHEWMCDTSEPPGKPLFRMSDDIVLYQDRTKDGNKSVKRFSSDKVLLLADHLEDPTEPRILFYLAQTCGCLIQQEEAFKYYKMRSELEGFREEKFHSYLRCGELGEDLKHDWYESFSFYMKAFEHTVRAEPLIKIAQYYNKKKNWLLSFTYANLACSLEYPHDCILFVDAHAYKYVRWHVLGIVAYYNKEYKIGKNACLKAIEAGLNVELDTNNLKFYIEKEKENEPNNVDTQMTKKQFIETHIKELMVSNPKLNKNKMTTIAKNKWKSREK